MLLNDCFDQMLELILREALTLLCLNDSVKNIIQTFNNTFNSFLLGQPNYQNLTASDETNVFLNAI
jgi:hypothetical protein